MGGVALSILVVRSRSRGDLGSHMYKHRQVRYLTLKQGKSTWNVHQYGYYITTGTSVSILVRNSTLGRIWYSEHLSGFLIGREEERRIRTAVRADSYMTSAKCYIFLGGTGWEENSVLSENWYSLLCHSVWFDVIRVSSLSGNYGSGKQQVPPPLAQ